MGSTIDAPVPIPCDEEDEQRETNLKLNPLSRLKKPPKTNYTSQIIDEELKKVIIKVEALLVNKLLTS